jgi:MFS family permease
MLVKFEPGEIRDTRWYEYATRFLFGGLITAAAGLIAQRFGPAVGGLFLAFPAIFPASASLIEKHEKEKKAQFGFDGTKRGRVAAGVDAAGAAMGTIGLMVFAVVSWKLLPQLPTWLTLFIATLAWAGTAAAAWMICRRRWRERHSGVPTQKHKELGA